MKKNPILAAVLNFLFFGGGTLYVGRRVGVGLGLSIGGTMAQIAEISVSPLGSNAIPNIWPLMIAGFVIAKLSLAVDGYREAQAANV